MRCSHLETWYFLYRCRLHNWFLAEMKFGTHELRHKACELKAVIVVSYTELHDRMMYNVTVCRIRDINASFPLVNRPETTFRLPVGPVSANAYFIGRLRNNCRKTITRVRVYSIKQEQFLREVRQFGPLSFFFPLSFSFYICSFETANQLSCLII